MGSRLLRLGIEQSILQKPTVIILILANLLPIYGVVFLGWEVFPILLLFWSENIIIGLFNLLKMAIASPADPGKWMAKIFIIPFFCLHYGIFTLVHGAFIFIFFGGSLFKGTDLPSPTTFFQSIGSYQLIWAILALLLSHGISFWLNYIGKSEYKQSSLMALMQQPYGRVLIMHITIIIGSFLVLALGSPAIALLLLVILKTGIDIYTHIKQHSKIVTIPTELKAI